MPQETDGGLPPIDTATRPVGDVVGVAIHHMPQQSGPLVNVTENVDAYHRAPEPQGNGWAGIGYHRTVQGQQLATGRTIEQVGAHEEGENRTWLAIAVVGPGDQADQQTIDTAGWQVATWEAELGKTLQIAGHRDLPGAQTACPGDPQLARKVRTAADRWHDRGLDQAGQDDDAPQQGGGEESDMYMRGQIVLYGSRGTPDYDSAGAIAGAIGAWATSSPGRAADALSAGATIIAVGGPAAREISELAATSLDGRLLKAEGGSALSSLQQAVQHAADAA